MFRTQSTRVGIYLGVIGFVAAAGLASAASAARATHTTPAEDSAASRSAMINVLGVPAPNPALGEEAQTFDRLLGTWDAEFSFPRPDGTVCRKKGEHPKGMSPDICLSVRFNASLLECMRDELPGVRFEAVEPVLGRRGDLRFLRWRLETVLHESNELAIDEWLVDRCQASDPRDSGPDTLIGLGVVAAMVD